MSLAMLQTLAVTIMAVIQAFFGTILVAPKNPKTIDYGGDPYVEEVIVDWLPIYENEETQYAIVIPDSAEKSIITGADWLIEFLGEMTGYTFKCYTVSENSARIADGYDKFIALGNTGLDGGALDTEIALLKNEGFVKKVVGDNIFIYGIGRGTMYGCASFIEEQLGCAWYTPDLKYIPKKDSVAIDLKLNYVENAKLEYRDVYFDVFCRDSEWKAFHKLNTGPTPGMGSYMGEEYGYAYNYIDFCHSMQRLVPDELINTKPDYFSFRKDKNTRTLDQRCLSNPEVLALTIENTLARIAAAPLDQNIMSVSQNDNDKACECANCLAKDAQYGGPSGTNIWFVNQVAQAVKDAFPNREIYIDTLAYDYTVDAPKNVKPLDNMIIRLCSIGACFCHPINECGHNREENMFQMFKDKPSEFAADIQDWSDLCDESGAKLYIWNYSTNYKVYSMPFPNLQVFSANYKFFTEHSVYGIFDLGNHDGGQGAEFDALKAYVLTKLMWDVDVNIEHVMEDFMNAYYGEAAAPLLREYMDAVALKCINTNHLFVFTRPEANVYFTNSEIAKFDTLWDEAEEKTTDQAQLTNIKRSRLSLRIYKANMMKGEFALFNPGRLEENKKLFHDCVMLGLNKFKESDPICMPYNDYVWAMRPFEWGEMTAWVDFVDEEKVVPLDLAKYRAEHQQ